MNNSRRSIKEVRINNREIKPKETVIFFVFVLTATSESREERTQNS